MHPQLSLTRRRVLALSAGTAVLPVGVFAQPAHTVRAIVNTTAGSGLDAIVRAVQPALAQALGASVVIENQAGASGLIGLQALARAPADGGTIGFASSNLVIFPSVLKSVPFDVASDFSPIAIVGEIPLVLVANPSRIRASNAKEFAAALKSKPDAFNYASSGSGTILHLATEMALQEIGAKVKHIPYKAATPMLTDTIGGQVDFCTAALPAALPHIKSGALRAIGLYTARRVALAPEIPTFAEQGIQNVVVQSWHSVLGPKGMAPTLVKKYHEAVATALKNATVRDALAKQATVIRLQTPEETQATIRGDLARYAKLVKQIGLEPQ
ncbi:MAG TPA: tripartite tricarboxylate transporter substrate binding protein [Ramlibacter sp.]|nr:tripartite tricarboxylate transporter substrate binding protein [Ramlibacter sp.]